MLVRSQGEIVGAMAGEGEMPKKGRVNVPLAGPIPGATK